MKQPRQILRAVPVAVACALLAAGCWRPSETVIEVASVPRPTAPPPAESTLVSEQLRRLRAVPEAWLPEQLEASLTVLGQRADFAELTWALLLAQRVAPNSERDRALLERSLEIRRIVAPAEPELAVLADVLHDALAARTREHSDLERVVQRAAAQRARLQGLESELEQVRGRTDALQGSLERAREQVGTLESQIAELKKIETILERREQSGSRTGEP